MGTYIVLIIMTVIIAAFVKKQEMAQVSVF